MGIIIAKMVTYLLCFTVSFYGLSAIDFSKILLPGPKKQAKAILLLVLLSLALGYLSATFILTISFKV